MFVCYVVARHFGNRVECARPIHPSIKRKCSLKCIETNVNHGPGRPLTLVPVRCDVLLSLLLLLLVSSSSLVLFTSPMCVYFNYVVSRASTWPTISNYHPVKYLQLLCKINSLLEFGLWNCLECCSFRRTCCLKYPILSFN